MTDLELLEYLVQANQQDIGLVLSVEPIGGIKRVRAKLYKLMIENPDIPKLTISQNANELWLVKQGN